MQPTGKGSSTSLGRSVTDIFISYAKKGHSQAELLANELQAKGFSVWYDTSLVPGDSFRDVILSKLAQAKAAIVIWDQNSVKSDWVCSEADRARARRILIPGRRAQPAGTERQSPGRRRRAVTAPGYPRCRLYRRHLSVLTAS